MTDSPPITDLITRVRAGDPEATADLVRRYEPVIRSRVRVWLRMQDPRLRRLFDSLDICQSVLASFFARASAGQYDLEKPEQLSALLVQMARHKLGHQVSKQTAGRRDVRRVDGGGLDGVPVATREPSPSQRVAGRELLQAVRSLLSDEERRIADRRADGHDWAAIAADMGGTPAGRRMQLARALDRVTDQLGLNDSAPA